MHLLSGVHKRELGQNYTLNKKMNLSKDLLNISVNIAQHKDEKKIFNVLGSFNKEEIKTKNAVIE